MKMKKRILCVEDDADARDLILSILKDYDYEIIFAVGLEDALHKARAKKFDLYLVDYYLPDGLGMEFILAVNSHRETPTIIVTGATSLNEPQADRFGAYGLIKKNSPSFVEDLRDEVNQLLASTESVCENL
jgi:DNA-binding NtrC family response regulator